jgi:hypothetical protein
MSVAALNAAADWNAEKGCALYRQHHYEKNNFKQATMLSDAARHLRNHDNLRRQAFLLSHTRSR